MIFINYIIWWMLFILMLIIFIDNNYFVNYKFDLWIVCYIRVDMLNLSVLNDKRVLE